MAHLWDASWSREWSGMSGLTAWSAYKTLLLAARHHGDLIPAGVRISISMRQWAERTGVGMEAANKARKLLMREELIRRDGRGRGPESGAFVLLTGARSIETIIKGYHLRREVSLNVPRCFASARVSLRWGAGRLGKFKEALLDALRRLGNSATDRELAVAIRREKRVREVRRRLEELVSENILKRHGIRYYFHEDSGIELSTTRLINGEIEAGERQTERHEDERKRYREAWERGEVLSKPKLAKRRRAIAGTERERQKVGEGPVVAADSSGRVAESSVEIDARDEPLNHKSGQPPRPEVNSEILSSASEVLSLARQFFSESS